MLSNSIRYAARAHLLNLNLNLNLFRRNNVTTLGNSVNVSGGGGAIRLKSSHTKLMKSTPVVKSKQEQVIATVAAVKCGTKPANMQTQTKTKIQKADKSKRGIKAKLKLEKEKAQKRKSPLESTPLSTTSPSTSTPFTPNTLTTSSSTPQQPSSTPQTSSSSSPTPSLTPTEDQIRLINIQLLTYLASSPTTKKSVANVPPLFSTLLHSYIQRALQTNQHNNDSNDSNNNSFRLPTNHPFDKEFDAKPIEELMNNVFKLNGAPVLANGLPEINVLDTKLLMGMVGKYKGMTEGKLSTIVLQSVNEGGKKTKKQVKKAEPEPDLVFTSTLLTAYTPQIQTDVIKQLFEVGFGSKDFGSKMVKSRIRRIEVANELDLINERNFESKARVDGMIRAREIERSVKQKEIDDLSWTQRSLIKLKGYFDDDNEPDELALPPSIVYPPPSASASPTKESEASELDLILPDSIFLPAQELLHTVIFPMILPNFLQHMSKHHATDLTSLSLILSQTNLTQPASWYPFTRLMKRKVIFHGGPTNSGKTYEALQRLKGAGRGLYLGPLRLLALEVYDDLTSSGIYCSLSTGQERREVAFSTHNSSTIEMCNLNDEFDVVVIDEIQMLSDASRGYAWSRALMGVRCREIHVCGGLEAEAAVRVICNECGDDFELFKYQRFNELIVADEPLNSSGDYRNVRAGDCIVAFGRNDIFAIRREIETLTNFKCCVVYGNLPPETRASQARMFNDANSGYDILVASDAIGMGLNLNIRRIIFHTIYKSDGVQIQRLDHSSLKQIAGRAGRRSSEFKYGEVTCRRGEDLEFIKEGMPRDIVSFNTCGLLPSVEHIEQFSEALTLDPSSSSNNLSAYAAAATQPPIKLSMLLEKFNALSKVNSSTYFLCRQSSISTISETIEDLPLTLSQKFVLCTAPLNTYDPIQLSIIRNYAEAFAMEKPFGLHVNIPSAKPKSFEELGLLCGKHNQLDLYLWLALRFPGKNDIEVQNVYRQKRLVIDVIDECLRRSGDSSGAKGEERLKLEHNYRDHDRRIRKRFEEGHVGKDTGFASAFGGNRIVNTNNNNNSEAEDEEDGVGERKVA